MREDHDEALQKMFPKGFVIVYIQPDEDGGYVWYNPKKNEFLERLLIWLNDLVKDCTK